MPRRQSSSTSWSTATTSPPVRRSCERWPRPDTPGATRRLVPMRVDIVTIFPDFFGVLDISLLGKARGTGLLDLRVHDLRDSTHDRHRTVDDTPYGGGAGMVMKPEPWGEAIDAILASTDAADPLLILPSPAGTPFVQSKARELA